MPGMIVAPQPAAVEAGARVLAAGGNAVDAAVTAAFVQTVLDPQMCGIGGYALLTMQRAGDAAPIAMDAPALAGARVTPDMWVDHIIGPNPDGWGYFLEGKVNDAGYTSICTPGTVKALAAMLDRWGTVSWADAIAPAADLADRGFMVTAHLASRWHTPRPYPEACSMLDYIVLNKEASRIYLHDDGSPYAMGQTLRNPDYAATLRALAAAGPEDLYTGALAARMTTDLAAHGSFVTPEDLAAYTLRDDPAVTGTYRGFQVASSMAPHGGPTLIAILNILEGYDLAALGHNSAAYIYLVAMAMKAAFADRNRHMADPYFTDVPVDWMIDKARAAHWRDRIDAGDPIEADDVVTGHPDTTHVTVVDDAGNCVSLTHSLGASSGVITPGLGFMYNNSMINFDPYPGNPNSIAPGKSRTTGMAPTIVYQDGKPRLVVGAPGASRIITSIVQVMLNVLDFGMGVEAAVYAPRFDCQVNDIRCHLRIPEATLAEVRKRHPIRHIPQSHGGFALVNAIHIDPATGALTGAADSGTDGMALGA